MHALGVGGIFRGVRFLDGSGSLLLQGLHVQCEFRQVIFEKLTEDGHVGRQGKEILCKVVLWQCVVYQVDQDLVDRGKNMNYV